MHTPGQTSPTAQGGRFATTHWSVVLTAGDSQSPQAQAALEALCKSYWYPLYAYARQRGYGPEEAEDLTQEFFLQVLEKKLLCGVKREGAKFRSFLLAVFKCFLASVWRREHAQKRGGGQMMLPIDEAAETRYQQELVVDATPETLFDRQWASTILERVLSRLREQYSLAGQAEMFEQLRKHLPGAERGGSYRAVAASLKMNEPAARMAVHRLRRRFGELLRLEIMATVSSPAEIDGEIRFLLMAASS